MCIVEGKCKVLVHTDTTVSLPTIYIYIYIYTPVGQ